MMYFVFCFDLGFIWFIGFIIVYVFFKIYELWGFNLVFIYVYFIL